MLPWCCPAAGIRLIAGQSNTRRRPRPFYGLATNQPTEFAGAEIGLKFRDGLWDSARKAVRKCAKIVAVVFGGQGFGTLEALILKGSDSVPKLTLCGTLRGPCRCQYH